MRPLVTAQKLLTWLCIRPDDIPVNRWKKLAQTFFTAAILMVILCVLFGSILFVIKFFSIDLKTSLAAITQVYSYLPTLYMFIIAMMMRGKINEILTNLNEIYDERK